MLNILETNSEFRDISVRYLMLAIMEEDKNRATPTKRPHMNPKTYEKEWKKSNNDLNEEYGLTMRQMYIPNRRHCCKKPLDELRTIALKEMMVPKVHIGHYLLCRTITPSCNISINGASCIIEDKNGDVEQLIASNFHTNLNDDPNKFLPKGTIMIIKEPYLKFVGLEGKYSLRCDSPSDIVILEPTDERLKELAPKWMVKPDPNDTFEILKEKANELYRMKEYDESIKFYNRASRIGPTNATIYLNRSAAYLQLNRFCEAYEQAKMAEKMAKQGEDIDMVKVYYRMGKAAYGMRDWKLALEHFMKLLNHSPENQFGLEEMKKTEERLKESSTGKYDMKFMFDEYVKKGNHYLDVADYVGPVEVCDVQGKGKGLFATKNVRKGTLLLVSKAFSYAPSNMNLEKSSVFSANLIVNKVEVDHQVVSIINTIQALRKNPHRVKDVYSLYAGELERNEEIPYGVVDVGRIEQIYTFDGFGSQNIFTDAYYDLAMSPGLWILPSYINHSCIASASRVFYGDVMMIYAVKDLKKGEEITMHYLEPLDSYQFRFRFLSPYRFVCDCELCKLDREDELYDQREELCKKTERFEKVRQSPKKSLEEIASLINEIRKTFRNRKDLKIQLVKPLFLQGELYRSTSEFEKAYDCYTEIRELLGVLEYDMFPPLHLRITQCLVGSLKLVEACEFLKEAVQKNGPLVGLDIELFKYIYSQELKYLLIYEYM